MKSKRVKISFDSVNQSKITLISRVDISEINERVKGEMRDVVRKHGRNESISHKEAAKLVLNA